MPITSRVGISPGARGAAAKQVGTWPLQSPGKGQLLLRERYHLLNLSGQAYVLMMANGKPTSQSGLAIAAAIVGGVVVLMLAESISPALAMLSAIGLIGFATVSMLTAIFRK